MNLDANFTVTTLQTLLHPKTKLQNVKNTGSASDTKSRVDESSDFE